MFWGGTCAEISAIAGKKTERPFPFGLSALWSRIEKKHRTNSHLIIHCPTSSGVSERASEWVKAVSKPVNGASKQSEWAKRAYYSRVSEGSERRKWTDIASDPVALSKHDCLWRETHWLPGGGIILPKISKNHFKSYVILRYIKSLCSSLVWNVEAFCLSKKWQKWEKKMTKAKNVKK